MYKRQVHNIYDGNIDLLQSAQFDDMVLFNLESDINESEDLALKEAEVFISMKSEFINRYGELLEGSHVWVRDEQKN